MISQYLANKLLEHTLKHVSYTSPTTVYLAFFTDRINFTDNIGTPTEVSGGAYARTSIAFAAAAGGAIQSNAAVTFPAPSGANWGTIKSVAICDASSSGNILYYQNLCQPITVNDGDPAPSYVAGAITEMMGLCEGAC